MTPTKIILIGFMATGKSTIAHLLSQRIGMQVVEMDALIVEASGLETISEIFATQGEAGFRDLEASIAHSLKERSNVIISTGGGVINRPENMKNLTYGGGVVVFLRTGFEEIRRRAASGSDRPLLNDPIRAQQLFSERLPMYMEHANITIETDGKAPLAICDEIIEHIRVAS